MRNFVKNFFANPFGNFLAITNLVVIALNRIGATDWLGLQIFELLSFVVNLPARTAAIILSESFIRANNNAARFDIDYYSLGILLFIYLQWVFIGWTAKAIARQIQHANR